MFVRARIMPVAVLSFSTLVLSGGVRLGAADTSATKTIDAGDLSLTVPESWEKQPVRSQFRKAQLKVPNVAGDKGDTEFVVYFFDGGGGGVDANVQRWVGSFLPAGRKVKASSGKSPQGEYVFVDCQGTWKKPIGPMVQQKTEETPNSRALSVMLTTNNGPYYIRLTGPEKTVSANVDAFRATFGGDAKKEKDRAVAQD